MTDLPLVDVIVATNRNSRFLREGLESVAHQEYPAWVLTVVDDGCPDPQGIEWLVHEIVPSATMIHQENSGQAAARNAAIRTTTAPLVTFLDDDDVWRPDRLSLLVAALKDSALAAYSGGWYLNQVGERFGEGWPGNQASARLMLKGQVPIPRIITMLIRRDALEEINGFNEGYRFAEDDDLILRLLLRGEMAGVPDQLVGYRRHDENLTNSPWPVRREASEMVIKTLIERAREDGNVAGMRLMSENYRRFLERAVKGIPAEVAHNLRAKNSEGALSEIAWALRRAPFGLLREVIRTAADRSVRWVRTHHDSLRSGRQRRAHDSGR